ncbi:pseudouridine synthase [soil metagenome]
MQESGYRYFIINKPTNMVSQFVSSHDVGLLGDLDYDFPEGIHAIGRLDGNSEGLLILTTNQKVTKLLFQGAVPHKRVYLVQVMNHVSEESLNKLRAGVTILIKGGEDYITPPCEVSIVTNPELLAVQAHALPAYIPVTWLLIALTEGKFRQVRKMVKAIRHKCKRLIRVSIEDLILGDLQQGCVREIEEKIFFRLLKIDNWQ